MRHASLTRDPANLIGDRWVPIPGGDLQTRNPAEPASVVYSATPSLEHVGAAVLAARVALPRWSALDREARFAVLRRFGALAKERAQRLAEVVCDEIGKVMWECKQEAGLLANKVDITLDPAPEGGLRRVTPFEIALSPTRRGRCLFRPHGVVAVLGPFNFPLHLPNGHIVPALATGNTVVLKPSDKAAACGQALAELFDDALRLELGAGYIPGVVNLVQGKGDVAAALASHEGVDAIAFTGSWPVGRRILEANLDRPGRIVALELGGNNPALVMPDADLRLAAIEIARSAFSTTGQRCTCTRRAIIHEAVAGKLIPAICQAASALIIGPPRATHPVFMGPLNNEAAMQSLLSFQRDAMGAGAQALVSASRVDSAGAGWFVSPSVLRVERFSAASDASPGRDAGCDMEIFGPLLRVCVVKSLDEGIDQANATRFGLAASIFTSDPAAQDAFLQRVRAGCININTGTAGASSKLPFGGLGLSGNHRPAGSFALDYCAYPVASMVETNPSAGATIPEGMRFDDAWVR
jgi:succinylglutamic semialdehyde dehydrogenase